MARADAPKSLEPRAAAAALEAALGAGFRGELTIADAAAKSGLALRDAEAGLFSLVSTYRGHLGATEKGELLYRFPDGFSRAWERKTKLQAFGRRVEKGAAGALRFVVRAWIAIVLVGYAGLFLAIILGMMFANSSGGGRDRRSVSWAPLLLRVIFDALFWTFHPFSPVGFASRGWGEERGYGGYRQARREDEGPKVPFYERVNRYFFGPTKPPEDPRALEKAVVQQIRAQKGRIGLSDVLRVTGLPRDEADPLLARLMLDYDGEVDVGEAGGIVYRFESLRLTAEGAGGTPQKPPAVWEKKEELPPLTGNEAGTNVLVTALNGFNLVMGLVAIEQNLTLSKLPPLFHGIPLFKLPYDGLPIALGVIPIVFSIALFALPIARAVFRRSAAANVARENGRRALLRTVLTHGEKPITDGWLKASYEAGAGRAPSDKEITREVVALGGDLDVQTEGTVRYRFADLEAEEKDVAAEREAAAEEEARPGKVIFSSDA